MPNQSSTETIVFHAVGDVTPRRVDYGEAPESLFAKVHQRIKEADITFCQLEANLSTRGCLQYRNHTTWYGRAHPENVKSLIFGGFNVVSHASNHCFDYGPDSLLETIDVLRSNNIQVTGVGKDIAEARKPAILERKGIKVGFLAYNSMLPVEFEAREGKPGCAPIRVSTYYESQDFGAGMPPRIITIPLEDDVRAMEGDIRNLRNQADIVIVSMHWGLHHIPGLLAMYQPIVGHRAIDAGADLIVGHHAHLIKGIEIYKGRVIFYSLGNFAQETPHHLKPPPGAYARRTSMTYRKWQQEPGWERYGGAVDKRYSMMAKGIISKRAIQKVSFSPGWINQKAEPELLTRTDPRFDEVLHYLESWCQELGTALTVEGDEVVVGQRLPIVAPEQDAWKNQPPG
ncbi:MAG: CapA family protein [Chloroflexi bacterium]|nr:CapA family protein [Chloroflexota bacterium]